MLTATGELLFRGESVATKLVSSFMFKKGRVFLQKIISPVITMISSLKQPIEVSSSFFNTFLITKSFVSG